VSTDVNETPWCGCEIDEAGTIEQMCGAHWRYAYERINAGKNPPYIPGLPPLTLNLSARLEAAERDARRYRWLREQCDQNIGFWWAVCPPAPSAAITSPDELDAAIDAAIEREPELFQQDAGEPPMELP
jgi:hypothetical protein